MLNSKLSKMLQTSMYNTTIEERKEEEKQKGKQPKV